MIIHFEISIFLSFFIKSDLIYKLLHIEVGSE